MIGPQDEAKKDGAGAEWIDSVSLTFADSRLKLCGMARIEARPNRNTMTSLALVFKEGKLAGKSKEEEVERAHDGWEQMRVGRVEMLMDKPLDLWRVSLVEKSAMLDLKFRASGAPMYFAGEENDRKANATVRYEQVCTVEGKVVIDRKKQRISGTGSREHAWGITDWDQVARLRSIGAICEGGLAVAVDAVRPAAAREHDEEHITGYLSLPGSEPEAFERVLFSSTYNSKQEQQTAGMELYKPGSEMPRRLAGRSAFSAGVDLNGCRLNLSFFRWSLDGQPGVGYYQMVTRT